MFVAFGGAQEGRGMIMNEFADRQAYALKHHCRFAFETLNPRLSWKVLTGSVVLSVNTGYE